MWPKDLSIDIAFSKLNMVSLKIAQNNSNQLELIRCHVGWQLSLLSGSFYGKLFIVFDPTMKSCCVWWQPVVMEIAGTWWQMQCLSFTTGLSRQEDELEEATLDDQTVPGSNWQSQWEQVWKLQIVGGQRAILIQLPSNLQAFRDSWDEQRRWCCHFEGKGDKCFTLEPPWLSEEI